jgi:hypothetical protein
MIVKYAIPWKKLPIIKAVHIPRKLLSVNANGIIIK